MLKIQNITKSFGNTQVLKGINLDIHQGEIICLLGASGCGKTTLLRIVAGLEMPDSGELLLNDASIVATPPHQRGFGLMFQDFALFPHMNVAQNILFGMRMQGIDKTSQNQRLKQVLDLVGLSNFEKRDVSQLSGGEKQRVALARSLAPNPPLLMLDEPLGSLDAALRERLLVDLRNIIKQIHLTAIYVTHDQHEALTIADRIVVMNQGRIEQVNTPEAIYLRPKTSYVASFLGLTNLIPVTDQQGNHVTTPLGGFTLNSNAFSRTILIHPTNIALSSQSGADTLQGEVIEKSFQGDFYRIIIKHDSGIELTLHAPPNEIHTLNTGDSAYFSVKSADIVQIE